MSDGWIWRILLSFVLFRQRVQHRRDLGVDRAIERHFSQPEDLALARVPDAQGLGGSVRK
jgi:hypothetical protein